MDGFQNKEDYLQAGNDFIFRIKGFNNPPTTDKYYYIVETKHFKTPTYYTIDQSQTQFFVEATTGDIVVSSITPNQTEIYYSEGTYQFVLTPQHDCEPTYQFKLQFPPDFAII